MLTRSLGFRRRVASPVMLLWLSPLVVCAGCSSAPANPPVDIAAATHQLLARGDSLIAAEVAEDSARVMSYYADDAIIQPADMPAAKGHTEIGKLYATLFATGSLLSSTRTEPQVSAGGDMAWEHGINRVTMTGANTPNVGKYTLVWKKLGSEWKVAALSFSRDAPPPAPSAAKK